MKELHYYECEKCGSHFTNKDSAETCEQSHIAPRQIEYAQYERGVELSTNYPTRVMVEMTDGSVVSYYKKN